MKFLEGLKQVLHNFFSTSNEINEHVVVGVVLLGILIAGSFGDFVSAEKYYVLAGMTAGAFGFALIKK